MKEIEFGSSCYALLLLSFLLVSALVACQTAMMSPTVTPMPTDANTTVSTKLYTPTSTGTPTIMPTSIPMPTATSTVTLIPTPQPTSTIATAIKLYQGMDAVLVLANVSPENMPAHILFIIKQFREEGNISDVNKRMLDEWMQQAEDELEGLVYSDAPESVKLTFQAIMEGRAVSESEIIAHNEWVTEHNATIIPQVTATAEARAQATVTQAAINVQATATQSVIHAQATATQEANIARAAEGVICTSLPDDELVLTSPVAEWDAIYTWMVGSRSEGEPEPWVVGFELEPGTLIRAPISSEDYSFWGTYVSNASGIGNRGLTFYKTIGEDRYKVALVLPGKTEGERFELLTSGSGRPPILRGQAVARILTDEGLNRPFLNTPGRVDLFTSHPTL